VGEAGEVAIPRGGFELRGWTAPGEPAVLGIHEAATSSEVWRPLAAALGDRAPLAAYDRRGWGRSGAPPDYRRTTVEEQTADAEAAIEALGGWPLVVVGAGIGAIVALELAVHRAELVAAAVLVEPPLLALVPEATPAISADVEAIRRTVIAAGERLDEGTDPREAATAGAKAALELHLAGSLGALGGGAERIPEEIARAADPSPFALFAEVAAISGWTLPLAELPVLGPPAAVVVTGSTPPFLRRAAEALIARLPGADLRELPGSGLPQLGSPDELAAIALELG
jgi:pimeloyl-ACP methyl ester carboxylesterase